MIHNPILPGFYPDPSILRVGDDYYIANSTFEWFPGIPIHHSRDLVNWRLIGHALTRPSQLNLAGVMDSAGIWAPSLSFCDGIYYMIFTIVHTRVGPFKDVPNYVVFASSINGPWSEPIHLNSSGFDPSLLHGSDGRKWFTNIQWDYRKGKPRFAGILLQEFDAAKQKLVGPVKTILQKNNLIEGPNLYEINGWYYLLLAEGGTGWNHGISMARARAVDGPYEVDPQPLILTSRHNPGATLQKAGHGELVQTQSGEWYLVHLASRPVYPERRCMLGRETCLQKVRWTDDGWLRLQDGTTHAQVDVPAPADLKPHPWPAKPSRENFDHPLALDWCSLRGPIDESWANLNARPGWLRLRGRESLHSLFEQSFLAKRLTHFQCVAETRLQFHPTHFAQSAGLICWYDSRTHFYLRITVDDRGEKVVGIVLTDDGNYDELLTSQVRIGDWQDCYLRAEIEHDKLQFSASQNGSEWQTIGPVIDASKLSDDYGQGLHFTGTLVGICAQDLNGTGQPADFAYFEMKQH